jgi:hypothetical protein
MVVVGLMALFIGALTAAHAVYSGVSLLWNTARSAVGFVPRHAARPIHPSPEPRQG